MTLRVLHLEDKPNDAFLVKKLLAQVRDPVIELEQVDRMGTALKRLAQGGIDVVLSDLKLPDSIGLQTFLSLRKQAPHVPIILLTGTFEETQTALEAIREGAQDYLFKSEVTTHLLTRSIRYAIERKQTEEALSEANVRLKEISSVKDDFIAHVSHELRTPLTSVKEGLSLLADGILGPVSNPQQEFLKTVDQNMDRLTEIITNLLDLSKIEAGRMQLARKRIAIQPLVETVLKSCAPIVKGRALKAQIDPVPDLFADPGKVLQVLTNLLTNAVKFTQENGEIEVSVRSEERTVAVSVRDNGGGIAQEDLPKLFQKFSQVGPLGVQFKGTGLGLALCKEIVSLHKGTITVASEPGAGSTFTFTLPVYTPELALEESFQERITLTEHSGSPAVALMAVDCEPILPSSKRLEALERLAEAVRPQLKNGDIVLAQEPKWLFILAVVDPKGAQAIAERIRRGLGEIRVALGTAFYPVDGADLKSLMLEATSRWEGKGLSAKRILLADDDPTVLEVMQMRLQAAGFEVTTASDGEEVLKNIRGGSPIDLVLLDLKMPKLDGLEVCKQLKERPPHRKIPLIACTAYWQELESRRSELGISDLLRKPFRSKELLQKIQQVLAAP